MDNSLKKVYVFTITYLFDGKAGMTHQERNCSTILLTFAFKGEAKSFFQNHSLKKLSLERPIYIGKIQNVNHIIILTGLGPYQAKDNFKKYLADISQDKIHISHVINLGIAGGLNKTLNKNEIIFAKSVQIEKSNEELPLTILKTKNQENEIKEHNVKTLFKPVLNKEMAKKLDFDGVVDQELFSIAKIASMKNLKISSIKLISDLPFREITQFNSIKEELNQLSQTLHNFYINELNLQDLI